MTLGELAYFTPPSLAVIGVIVWHVREVWKDPDSKFWEIMPAHDGGVPEVWAVLLLIGFFLWPIAVGFALIFWLGSWAAPKIDKIWQSRPGKDE